MSDCNLLPIAHPEAAPAAIAYDELIALYRKKQNAHTQAEGTLLTFAELPAGKDAYNPSGTFEYKNDIYQWARIESRNAQDAVAMLFKEAEPYVFVPLTHVPALPLEDPFITVIEDQYIVGGVELRKDEHGTIVGYRTRFYKGHDPFTPEEFACGPEDMKDIRLVSYPAENNPHRVFVFTRPYIPEGARMVGRVGVTFLDSIEQLSPEPLQPEHTEIIPHLFAPAEWGGVNDAYVLENGLIAALAHVSKFDEAGKRHYAAAVFVMDPLKSLASPLEIIAERKDFPPGPVKVMPEYQDLPHMHDDLADVLFSSRLMPERGSFLTAEILHLTCGLSDTSVGVLPINNPFPALCAKYFSLQ